MLDEKARISRVGGSEVAPILNVDQFEDSFSVWARKRGGLPRGEPNERMRIGQILEPAILEIYNLVTGRKAIGHNQTLTDPARPWMAFTPDALVCGERRGVEIKVVFPDEAFQWGASVEDIPDRVRLQSLWYMSGLDYDQWDVFALIGGRPRLYTLDRDFDLEATVQKRVKRYWEQYLVGDKIPPITGSAGASAWLQHRYPRDRRPDLVKPTDEQLALFCAYADVRAEQARLKADRELLENQLKASLGEHEGPKLPVSSDRFTWKATKDSQKVNWQGIGLTLLTRYVEEKAVQEQIIADHTWTKKGTRRIYFKSKSVKPEEEADDE